MGTSTELWDRTPPSASVCQRRPNGSMRRGQARLESTTRPIYSRLRDATRIRSTTRSRSVETRRTRSACTTCCAEKRPGIGARLVQSQFRRHRERS